MPGDESIVGKFEIGADLMAELGHEPVTCAVETSFEDVGKLFHPCLGLCIFISPFQLDRMVKSWVLGLGPLLSFLSCLSRLFGFRLGFAFLFELNRVSMDTLATHVLPQFLFGDCQCRLAVFKRVTASIVTVSAAYRVRDFCT